MLSQCAARARSLHVDFQSNNNSNNKKRQQQQTTTKTEKLVKSVNVFLVPFLSLFLSSCFFFNSCLILAADNGRHFVLGLKRASLAAAHSSLL